VLDHQGVLQGYRGIARDISERKRAEEARLRAQVMEAAKLELEKNY